MKNYVLIVIIILNFTAFNMILAGEEKLRPETFVFNNKYSLKKISVTGEKYFDEVVLEDIYPGYKDRKLSSRLIENLINSIIDFYLDKSFPLVKVKVKDLIMNKELKNAELVLEIESGEYVMIYGALFKGANTTNKSVLIRETRLTFPLPFDDYISKTGAEYLYKTGMFVTKPGVFIVKKGNGYNYMYDLEEDKFNSINGLVGYSSKEEDGGFFGEFELYLGNMFGTFRQLSVFWKRISDDEELRLSYIEPWLYKWPLKSRWSFFQQFREKLFLEREYSTDLDYNYNISLNILTGASIRQIFPDSTYNGGQKSIQNMYYSGIRYSNIPYYESLDEGFISEMKLSGIRKKTDKVSNDAEIELSFAANYNFYGDFYFRTENKYVQTFSEDSLDIYDLNKLGGAMSVRGYREDQFLSVLSAYSKNEIYLKFSKRNGLFTLFDIGAYSGTQSPSEVKGIEFIFGYGAGIKFSTGIGEMKVTYAVPHEEGFESGKVHFRYITRF